MKYCPKCESSFSESTVKFCRRDGTKLIDEQIEYSDTKPLTGETSSRCELPTKLFSTTHSIAVLPFANMTSDPANEYFCDGLAEELLNALSRIEDLRVAARTSSFYFKNKNVNAAEIGKALNVGTILQGSVRRAGSRLRIVVQLVNAINGFQLWSERLDHEIRDIFAVQDKIASAVVKTLRVKTLGAQSSIHRRHHTSDPETYELYLKGRFYYNKYSARGWLKAIEYFERSVQKSPSYAPGYAGIAVCLGALWYFGYSAPKEIVPQWKAAVEKALELDEELAEAHFTLASILFFYEWKPDGAESEIKRAIGLNPNSVNAYWRYGMFLACREDFAQAVKVCRLALALDPLSIVAKFFAEWVYWYAGRFDEALEQIEKMLDLEPNFSLAYWQLGMVFAAQDETEKAVDAYERSISLGGGNIVLSYLGAAFGRAGRKSDAAQILAQLVEAKSKKYIPAINIARVCSGLGENEKAIEWLEEAVRERNGELVYLSLEAKSGAGNIWNASLQNDSRFQNVVRRTNFSREKVLTKTL